MNTMTITRHGEDYTVELWGLHQRPAEPEVGVAAEYWDVSAWNEELGGNVVLTASEEEEALRIVNEELLCR